MLRMALSAVAVLLLGLFAYLFFNDYFRSAPETRAGDLLSNATPPAVAPTSPQPPMQPVVTPVAPTPVPVAPVQPAPVVQTQPPAPVPVSPVAQPEVSHMKKTHIVQRGDTLSSINRQHFGTETYFGKIAAANGLKNRDRIRIGQVLVMPDLPVVEAAQSVEEENTTVSQAVPVPEDFEPIPPTLNITAPKK